MKSPGGPPMPALHGLWVSVFAIEALVKGDDLGHQLGALILGVLFTALVVSERRSHRADARHSYGELD